MPGVLLLSLAVEALQERFGPFQLRGIRKVKFVHPLRPDRSFSVHGEWTRTGAIRFRCESGEQLLAEGTLRVEGEVKP